MSLSNNSSLYLNSMTKGSHSYSHIGDCDDSSMGNRDTASHSDLESNIDGCNDTSIGNTLTVLDSDSDDTIIYDYSDYIHESGVLSNSDSHANNWKAILMGAMIPSLVIFLQC